MVMDAMGSFDMSRLGAGNVADALTKLAGVEVLRILIEAMEGHFPQPGAPRPAGPSATMTNFNRLQNQRHIPL